jgi:RNA polymerase sigma factor (sigma-70 family)
VTDDSAVTMERSLVHLARAGDDAAFERVLEPLLVPAHDLAFAVLRDRQAAEDAVQESAVRAWRSFASLREDGKARAWFLKIVLNQCRATMRTRWWRWHLFGDRADVAVEGGQAGVERRLDLERALRGLTRDQRAVLFLFFQLDLSHEEVARVLDVRIGTVKSRLHRAVARLREGADREGPGA